MPRVILVFANCRNPTARGDFTFAANIAKELILELKKRSIADIDVILVSTQDGIPRFEELYGTAVNGRIVVEGISIGLSSLETFDAVENTVTSFIYANRCKHPESKLVKEVLSPDSKLLFVDNMNQSDFFGMRDSYLRDFAWHQSQVDAILSNEDKFQGSTGFGPNRLGIPMISKAEDLPSLSSSQAAMLPKTDYGFMYLLAQEPRNDYLTIAQYIDLSSHKNYILVGDFLNNKNKIKSAYEKNTTWVTRKALPHIEYHQSLPYTVMRKMVANATGSLVLSTGISSTIEAMQDGKLTYYQNMSHNKEFVKAYLIAIKSIVSNDNSLPELMPQMIMQLSELLFANKPLNKEEMQETAKLFQTPTVNTRLINANKAIIHQASGKIATHLLNFIGGPRQTANHIQLAAAYNALDLLITTPQEGIRKATIKGMLFELKVFLKSITIQDLNKTDSVFNRTYLHWAVATKHLRCARALVKAGISVDQQDENGQTPLHLAVEIGDIPMIKMLIAAGARTSICDDDDKTPQDYTLDKNILSLFEDGHSQSIKLSI